MKNLIIIFALFFAACANNSTNTTNSQSPQATPATTAKANLTLEQVKNAISKQPVKNIEVYNAENDPNKLLGRPNGYIEKMNFSDMRLKDEQKNCSVEIFNNADEASRRKEYLEKVGKASPMFTEYTFQNNNALLRLDKSLTPAQADEYKKILDSL